MLEIHSAANASSLAKAKVESSLEDAARSGSAILLLCSGGSWLSILPEMLPAAVLPEALTVSVIDERLCTDAESNFRALSHTPFFAYATARGAHVIDPRASEGESAEETARRFEGEIKRWQSQSMRRAVIALLGVGSDGHTMGIFPSRDPAQFTEKFMGAAWVVSYDAGDGAPACHNRLTATGTFVAAAVSTAIIYASGEGKREALGRLTAEVGEFHHTPARIGTLAQQTHLYTDISL